jgi:viroplasmin and RNaseH domain-containing protein
MQHHMYTKVDSLNIYKNILKKSFRLKNLILNGDHAPKIRKSLNVEKFHIYVQEKLKKEFKLNQRQNKLEEEDFKNGKILIDAFEELIQDFSENEFKRNKIKKSEEIAILNCAIQNWGNKKYHDELLRTFLEVRKNKIKS